METINDNQIEIDAEDIGDVPAFPVAKDGETIDWEAQAKTYKGMAERRGTKLSKLKPLLTKEPKEGAAAAAQDTKKGETDYGQLAYLNSLGYKDAADQKFALGIVKDTGKPLEEVLNTPYVQAELKRMSEERATKAAAPAAGEGRNGNDSRDDVDYWLKKGELPPLDQPALRTKVVKAKTAAAKGGSNFTSNPVVGKA